MAEKVLILGASGFLGKHVKEKFFLDGKNEILAPTKTELDLKNYPQVLEYFTQQKPQIIINCSGLCGGVLENATRPADFLFENSITSLNAIKAASLSKPRKYVNISSACSYPDFQTIGELNPKRLWDGRPHETHAPYGLAKRFSCEAAQAFAAQYDLPAINLILANLYGPGDKFDNPASHAIPGIISRIYNAKKEGFETAVVYGSPNVTREFLFIADAADAIHTLAQNHNNPKPLNVGSGEAATIGDIVRQVSKLLDFEGVPVYQSQSLAGQYHRKLDLTDLNALGWKAKTAINQGLEMTVKAYIGGK